jgi:hypothetical protein
MKPYCSISGFLLGCLLVIYCIGMAHASPQTVQQVTLTAVSAMPDSTSFAAMPRWWEDTVQWVKSIGWDRSRLVQMWLFFMLVGLYVILRIKPRA